MLINRIEHRAMGKWIQRDGRTRRTGKGLGGNQAAKRGEQHGVLHRAEGGQAGKQRQRLRGEPPDKYTESTLATGRRPAAATSEATSQGDNCLQTAAAAGDRGVLCSAEPPCRTRACSACGCRGCRLSRC